MKTTHTLFFSRKIARLVVLYETDAFFLKSAFVFFSTKKPPAGSLRLCGFSTPHWQRASAGPTTRPAPVSGCCLRFSPYSFIVILFLFHLESFYFSILFFFVNSLIFLSCFLSFLFFHLEFTANFKKVPSSLVPDNCVYFQLHFFSLDVSLTVVCINIFQIACFSLDVFFHTQGYVPT